MTWVVVVGGRYNGGGGGGEVFASDSHILWFLW